MVMKTIIVAGAGGFIGGHLTKALNTMGHNVRAVDIKPLNKWYQVHDGVENMVLDLRIKENCFQAANGCNEIFNLAADMGGMGFIETHKAACMLSVLINTHMLMAAKECGIDRFFYASSACVYNGEKQTDPDNPGLRESDAYPALDMVGRSCSVNACAAILPKTSGCSHVLPDSIMCLGRLAHTMAAEKKLLRPFAGKSLKGKCWGKKIL